MSQPVVRLEGVRVSFGATPVLSDIDLTLAAGEVLGVAGPNGVGKSTLLGVIATFVQPTGGRGEVLGAELGTRAVTGIRRRIGLSGHEPGLYDHLTLAENLSLIARLARLPDSAVDVALDRVGLTAAADRRADRASNGMRRRVDLAALLMTDPDLVLLDEAHAGLDAEADAIVGAIVRRTVERGGGAVMVSHDAARLADETDRMLRLDRP